MIDFNWDDYFYDFVGVSKNTEEELVEVQLLFSKEQATDVLTKLIQRSRLSTRTQDGLEAQIAKILLFFGSAPWMTSQTVVLYFIASSLVFLVSMHLARSLVNTNVEKSFLISR